MELKSCPFCGKPAEFISLQSGFAIICSDHNCLGGIETRFGRMDNPEIFKAKLVANWNKRDKDVAAVEAAVECAIAYRDEVYDDCQEPYDSHGQCCVDVLDEVINRLRCFTCKEAVEAWNRRANDV